MKCEVFLLWDSIFVYKSSQVIVKFLRSSPIFASVYLCNCTGFHWLYGYMSLTEGNFGIKGQFFKNLFCVLLLKHCIGLCSPGCRM